MYTVARALLTNAHLGSTHLVSAHLVSALVSVGGNWSATRHAHELIRDHAIVGRLVVVAVILLLATIVVYAANHVLSAIYWRRITRTAIVTVDGTPLRSQREQTVLTTVQGLIRYVVYGVALFVIVGVIAQDVASALFASSLLVIVVGFGFQRLLTDIIAGALMLFDRQYAVGDFLEIHTPNVAGFVEEFTLRSTVLRTLSGDRVVVLNGAITASTRSAPTGRDCRIEFTVHGAAPALRATVNAVLQRATASPLNRWLLAPHIVAIDPIPESDLVRVELRAVVAPTNESLVSQTLASHLRDTIGREKFVGEIELSTVDESAFAAYRSRVLVP